MSFFNFFKPNVEKLLRNRDVEGLLEALKNKDEHTRAHASYALGEIRAYEAVDPLINTILTDAPSVRYEIARSLGLLKNPKAIPALIENFKFGIFFDPESRSLTDAYFNPVSAPQPGSTYKEVHDNVKAALIDIGAPAVTPLLKTLDDKSPYSRAFAANVLGVIGERRAVTPLCNLLQDDNWMVRGAAAWSLGELGDPEAKQFLKDLQMKETHTTIIEDINLALRKLTEYPKYR